MLIDSHCHLDFPELKGEIEAVLTRARDVGVGLMLTISTRVRRFDKVLALAEAHDNVFCSVGTHPHHAAEEPNVTIAELAELAQHPKVVAIGEAGLDYYYDNSPRDMQKKSFRTHIGAARETGLPLVIHARDADADVARMLREETRKGAFAFVLHCFTSGPELARAGLELGGYLSFSGVITFKKSDALRDIALAVPHDRLLVETDAPYLSPEPVRGQTNEPAFVVYTASRLAALRGLSEAEMARSTTENFFHLFSKVPRSAVKAPASAA
jgi:TatD DNase family protein